jgi:hypothetical protein
MAAFPPPPVTTIDWTNMKSSKVYEGMYCSQRQLIDDNNFRQSKDTSNQPTPNLPANGRPSNSSPARTCEFMAWRRPSITVNKS